MPTLYIASDHAGFSLKELLKKTVEGYTIHDIGPFNEESCDYPVFAHELSLSVEKDPASRGILICGTGLGMSMAANRHAGIRAALCTTELHARLARQHNNANVLCLGARMTGTELAKAIVTAFLETDFEGGRHERRLALL